MTPVADAYKHYSRGARLFFALTPDIEVQVLNYVTTQAGREYTVAYFDGTGMRMIAEGVQAFELIDPDEDDIA